jgi:hypothetical protein
MIVLAMETPLQMSMWMNAAMNIARIIVRPAAAVVDLNSTNLSKNNQTMMLQGLAYYEQLSVLVKDYLSAAASYARKQLGPEPQSYYLLSDGQVLPTTTILPESVFKQAYVYDPHTLRITLASYTTPEGRFKRLPYIALQVCHPDTETIDMSDWLGEVRANPVPELDVKQLVVLWSYVHRQYVPIFSGGATIKSTNGDGEESSVTL